MKTLVPILLLGLGCDRATVRYEPFCQPDAARAEWVAKCAEAANPKSDEEGEDLVAQCDVSSKSLFCKHRWVSYNDSGGLYKPVPCSLTKEPDRLRACSSAGWDPKSDASQ